MPQHPRAGTALPATGTPGLALLNSVSPEVAAETLYRVCAAPAWVAALVAGRPYPDVDALLAASDAATRTMTEEQLDAAITGHARIGRKPAGPLGEDSRREQAGVDDRDTATLTALEEGNHAYEERFGHTFLICASGRSGPEILAELHRRLTSTAEAERATAREELRRINRLRLEGLVAR